MSRESPRREINEGKENNVNECHDFDFLVPDLLSSGASPHISP
jgi:hypothetical protein